MHTHKDLIDREIRRPTGLPIKRVTRGKFMLCSRFTELHHKSLGRYGPSRAASMGRVRYNKYGYQNHTRGRR